MSRCMMWQIFQCDLDARRCRSVVSLPALPRALHVNPYSGYSTNASHAKRCSIVYKIWVFRHHICIVYCNNSNNNSLSGHVWWLVSCLTDKILTFGHSEWLCYVDIFIFSIIISDCAQRDLRCVRLSLFVSAWCRVVNAIPWSIQLCPRLTWLPTSLFWHELSGSAFRRLSAHGRTWNDLPDDVTSAESLSSFSQRLKHTSLRSLLLSFSWTDSIWFCL